jgi:predicted ATPase with chaperone activity
MSQLDMSARAFHRTAQRLERGERLGSVKLARRIAGLAGAPEIKTYHLAEAVQRRPRRLTQLTETVFLAVVPL